MIWFIALVLNTVVYCNQNFSCFVSGGNSDQHKKKEPKGRGHKGKLLPSSTGKRQTLGEYTNRQLVQVGKFELLCNYYVTM